MLVPEADALVRRPGSVAAWQKLLADKGRLVVAVGNPERSGGAGGVGYYELHDAVGPHFPKVQMLGVTPFLGVGLVEFDGAVDGLRVDARLVKAGSEPPAVYVAVAGSEPFTSLGYALVQLPFSGAPLPSKGVHPALVSEVGGTADLRRQLDEAASQAESAMRVARAQGDEIEELRGRLRRAAEDRAALDAEIAKLRRGLAEADESVMSLTRRTAEEMAVVAERLAAGLRGPSEAVVRSTSAELSAARDEADRLRGRLAETESRAAAAEQRLEEMGGAAREKSAALEDALERLRLSESELGRARRAAAKLEGEAQRGDRGRAHRRRARSGARRARRAHRPPGGGEAGPDLAPRGARGQAAHGDCTRGPDGRRAPGRRRPGRRGACRRRRSGRGEARGRSGPLRGRSLSLRRGRRASARSRDSTRPRRYTSRSSRS